MTIIYSMLKKYIEYYNTFDGQVNLAFVCNPWRQISHLVFHWPPQMMVVVTWVELPLSFHFW